MDPRVKSAGAKVLRRFDQNMRECVQARIGPESIGRMNGFVERSIRPSALGLPDAPHAIQLGQIAIKGAHRQVPGLAGDFHHQANRKNRAQDICEGA
jgi:hypothetical protein